MIDHDDLNALSILLAHDRWAMQQALAAARSLSDAQLDRPFEMGRGTLRATLHHMVDAMNVWAERMHGRTADPTSSPPSGQSIGDLVAWNERVADQFALAVNGDPKTLLKMPRKGHEIIAPRIGIAMHVMTHGMHHRAQALNMMRHLGVSPLPLSSVFEWMNETKLMHMT
jgi:uncharacterized damage-inducible protein DinB